MKRFLRRRKDSIQKDKDGGKRRPVARHDLKVGDNIEDGTELKSESEQNVKKVRHSKQGKRKTAVRRAKLTGTKHGKDTESDDSDETDKMKNKKRFVSKKGKKAENDFGGKKRKSKLPENGNELSKSETSKSTEIKNKNKKKESSSNQNLEATNNTKHASRQRREKDIKQKQKQLKEISRFNKLDKEDDATDEEEESDKDDDDDDGQEESEEEEDEEDTGTDNDIQDEDSEDEDGEESEPETSECTSTLKTSSSAIIPLENQAKFYQERALGVEKHYGQFCQLFGSITRKLARTRDKGDLLSKQLLDFAKQEKISHSSSKNLKEFAHNLAAIQDYRDAEIKRLENKVVRPLSAYGPKCKQIKQLIKREQGAINREIKQRKTLDKVREKKPGDAHSISASTSQAETEVKKAAESAQIGLQGLQNQMCTFEKEKLGDLKSILADFVSIELVFHAKAIEFYSQCFDNLAMIDDEMDLEEFKRKITLEQGQGPLTPQGPIPPGTATSAASGQMMSTLDSTGSEYTSTGASYTYTYGDSTTSSGEKRVRIQTQSMYADDDDDDDDDEDDDDDDDDYEDDVQHYSRPIRR